MQEKENDFEVRPEVMTYDDIAKMVPRLKKHKKLVEWVLHLLKIDEVNAVHARWCKDPGIPFSHHLIDDEFKIKLRVDNEEILSRFPEGPFITVSNHPFGALDGISLLHLVGTYRPDFKVMVNLILNQISAMRPGFIAVDPSKSTDPEKRKTTMHGIREAMKQVRSGHPLGFFPAGGVSNVNRHLRLEDREWQPSIIRLIQQMKVPVIPIYFHGHNSWWFTFLGIIDWRIRTLRLPGEVFRRRGKTIHVSVGEPISPEEQAKYTDEKEFGLFLRHQTYKLKALK